MNLGIFIAGVFVTLIVTAAMGLLVWGFRMEARANARRREQQDRLQEAVRDDGEPAQEPSFNAHGEITRRPEPTEVDRPEEAV